MKDSKVPNLVKEREAYVLGILYTDGYYTSSGGLGLKQKDKEAVEALSEILGSSVRQDKKGYWYTERVNRPVLRRMEYLGLHPEKTYYQNPPNLPRELHRHFVRGVMDGDGSIKKDGRVDLHIVESPLVGWISKFLDENEILYSVVNTYKTKSGAQLQKISIKVKDYNSIRFLGLIYEESSFYIGRKYKRYHQLNGSRARNGKTRKVSIDVDVEYRELSSHNKEELRGILISSGELVSKYEGIFKIRTMRPDRFYEMRDIFPRLEIDRKGRIYYISIKSKTLYQDMIMKGMNEGGRFRELVDLTEREKRIIVTWNATHVGNGVNLYYRDRCVADMARKYLFTKRIDTTLNQNRKVTTRGKSWIVRILKNSLEKWECLTDEIVQ